jgi:tripartite ATP-independent transporter DctM subunit
MPRAAPLASVGRVLQSPTDGSPLPGRAIEVVDRALCRVIEFVAASIVVAEIGLLFAGVIARYVFHRPIVWSDELAGAMFLWLSMLGAVIALRRSEHMCFGALAGRMSRPVQVWLQTLVVSCIVVFLCLLLRPGWEYIEDESFATMPSLGFASSWRVSGIETGVILMLVTVILQGVRHAPPRVLLGCLATVAAIAAALWSATPILLAVGNLNLLVFFVVLVGASIVIGVPIGFAFGISTIAYLGLMTSVPLSVVINRLDQGVSQPLLLAIPMFIFLGFLIDITGLARSMINLLAALMGSVRGGLYYVLLGAMILVSGISGSKAADMAAVAPGLFPEMRRRGAQEGDLVALLASSAAMADTIPPSLVLITLGSVTGISIASLFAAGLMPALVLAASLAIVTFFRSRVEAVSTETRPTARQMLRIFVVALPALILPFVIRWAVVDGVATATEVSTIGIVYALLVGAVVYGPMRWARLYPALVATASLAGAILFVIGTATGMAWALTQSGFSSDLAATMERVSGGRYGFMAITVVVFILLGNILEGIPAILLFGPLLLPVSHSLGIHDVHYAMVVVIAMSIGLFAPPFGVGFYAACAIGRVAPENAIKHVWRYLGAMTIALCLIAAIPWFSTAFL